MDLDKLFEIDDDGILLGNGKAGVFVGNDDPSTLPSLPTGSIYLRTNGKFFVKDTTWKEKNSINEEAFYCGFNQR